ncbi:hypothetical protein NDU88_003417 [Pleurodeles waltl]|uniref:Uncharacterized protein n=1 Tax=Pleurodeles waltl TaxID=8319 RepID=A0AAV7T5A6_PLEWA|nr:hypothetical protein NDU88_003417 [Pleurodeles waltl]
MDFWSQSGGGRGPTDSSPVPALLGQADTVLSSAERTGRDSALELRGEAENRGPATRGEIDALCNDMGHLREEQKKLK